MRKQELESILIPIAEPIFGKCKLFVISYGDCPSNYGKDTSALELLGASEEYPLVQVCVYTTKDANQRDEDMQKWTEALQERRYFVCANIDYLSSETYDKVEQKSYQYINGDDDYICRGSAFISPDNFKWRFGGWEEKMTDGTPFPPLDTLVSQKRKTEYQLPRRGRQAAPFSYLKLNTNYP